MNNIELEKGFVKMNNKEILEQVEEIGELTNKLVEVLKRTPDNFINLIISSNCDYKVEVLTVDQEPYIIDGMTDFEIEKVFFDKDVKNRKVKVRFDNIQFEGFCTKERAEQMQEMADAVLANRKGGDAV